MIIVHANHAYCIDIHKIKNLYSYVMMTYLIDLILKEYHYIMSWTIHVGPGPMSEMKDQVECVVMRRHRKHARNEEAMLYEHFHYIMNTII